MYLNGFSVRVVGGKEQPGGYVEMDHGTAYSLCLRNGRAMRCDARVEIDGKHVGTWRIGGQHSITLERPAHDTGRLTFYQAGTPEAARAVLSEYDPNLGLVKVTFTPETQRARVLYGTPALEATTVWPESGGWTVTNAPPLYGNAASPFEPLIVGCCMSRAATNYAAGGTGLSGQSGQEFGMADAIEYDTGQQTVIHLRLVARRPDNGPRPLTAYSTPVPPAVR